MSAKPEKVFNSPSAANNEADSKNAPDAIKIGETFQLNAECIQKLTNKLPKYIKGAFAQTGVDEDSARAAKKITLVGDYIAKEDLKQIAQLLITQITKAIKDANIRDNVRIKLGNIVYQTIVKQFNQYAPKKFPLDKSGTNIDNKISPIGRFFVGVIADAAVKGCGILDNFDLWLKEKNIENTPIVMPALAYQDFPTIINKDNSDQSKTMMFRGPNNGYQMMQTTTKGGDIVSLVKIENGVTSIATRANNAGTNNNASNGTDSQNTVSNANLSNPDKGDTKSSPPGGLGL